MDHLEAPRRRHCTIEEFSDAIKQNEQRELSWCFNTQMPRAAPCFARDAFLMRA
jgi:hypothetical protein